MTIRHPRFFTFLSLLLLPFGAAAFAYSISTHRYSDPCDCAATGGTPVTYDPFFPDCLEQLEMVYEGSGGRCQSSACINPVSPCTFEMQATFTFNSPPCAAVSISFGWHTVGVHPTGNVSLVDVEQVACGNSGKFVIKAGTVTVGTLSVECGPCGGV